MNREIHVRICGRLRAKFPGPTRREETDLCQTGLRRWGESPANRHREATVTAPLLDSTRDYAPNGVSERNRLQQLCRIEAALFDRVRSRFPLQPDKSARRATCSCSIASNG